MKNKTSQKTSSIDALAILRSAPDLYLILNPEFKIIEVSDSYLKATMVQRKEILNRVIFDVFPDNPDDPTANGVKNLKASLESVLKNKVAHTMSIQKYDIQRPKSHGGGFEERYWSPRNSPILDEDGNIRYIVHRVEDITDFIRLKKIGFKQQKLTHELKERTDKMEIEIYQRAKEIHEANQQLQVANAKLEKIAHIDILTDLANRKYLTLELTKNLMLAKQNKHKIALMFIDLDQFKLINDTLGHRVGDLLLKIIAQRLTTTVQTKDVVARLGGDEFVILLNDIKDAKDIDQIAQRVLSRIKEPIQIENHKLFVSGSIGISVYPDSGEDEITLLQNADIAMYFAKQSGRNNFQFCTAEMIRFIQKKMDCETELRHALADNKFILYYQPQIDLQSGEITGIETLVRLQRENGKTALPGEFMTIAEESGLIVPIGEWILRNACEQYKHWQLNDKSNIRLAVNYSPRQLREPDFLQKTFNILKETKMNTHQIEFEVTERPIIQNMATCAKILRDLKNAGVRLALDDFGVGYSSLNYLRQFNFDTLKIDRSLLQNIPADDTDSEIIASIINMAHAMQIEVIAEGIETPEQTRFLRTHFCDKIQGNYFSTPLSADEMTKLLLEKKNWKLVDIS